MWRKISESWRLLGIPGRSLLKIVIVFSLAVSACGKQDRPVNLLIIGVDTLRPDHLGCYGYGRDTSPNIDRLAAGGVLIENTVSQAPWTLPSFASMFTSLYPTQHGAGSLSHRMRTSFPTLATIFADAGYATGAVISAGPLAPETGVGRGFEYYDIKPRAGQRSADEVTDCALRWIDAREKEPFFLFLHYWDPHDPYSPPAPYDTLFDPGYEGPLGDRVTPDLMRGAIVSRASVPDADLNHVVSLYDGEIAFTDRWIGELLDGMRDRGLLDHTLVVLMSDHGEEFLEHGDFGHGHSLFNEVLRVPLVFSLLGVLPAGARLSRQVRLIDVAPSILDLMGLECDSSMEGVSLAPELTGTGDVVPVGRSLFSPEAAYSEGLKGDREKKSVTAYPFKLIYELSTMGRTMFDLRADPLETHNMIAEQGQAAAFLEKTLLEALSEMSDAWYLEMSADGTPRTFSLRITAGDESVGAWIEAIELADDSGRVIDLERYQVTAGPGPVLEIKCLPVEGTLTLSVKAHAPRGRPVRFDFKIDGEAAIGRTFVGSSLSKATRMPFTKIPRRALAGSMAGPSERPRPPYILLWHTPGEYGIDIPSNLREETKKQLRALGYIQ